MGAFRRFPVLIACALMAAAIWWMTSSDATPPATTVQREQTGEEVAAAIPMPLEQQQPPLEPAAQPSGASGTLRGQVIDAATKAPVRDFRLELQRLPAVDGLNTPQPKTIRDPNGRFEWTGIRPDRWRLIVSAADYQRFELDDVVVDAARPAAELLIPLRRGAMLAGRVHDRANGQPIPRAKITYREAHVARFAADWRHRHAVSTDDRGLFRIEGLPRGRVTLSVSAPEYAELELEVVTTNDPGSVEIALSAGATIAGLLTEGDGLTATAGSVGLIHLENDSGVTITTEPNGEFAFRNLSPGRYRLIGKSEHGRAEQALQLAMDERRDGVVLAIQAGGTIRGLIRGVRAQDLGRLSITVRRPNSGMTNSSNARIDEYGGYVLNGVEPGRMLVIADLAMRRQLIREVDMAPNGDLTVDFDFPPAVKLSGRITRGGLPFASTQVMPERVGGGRGDSLLYPTGTNGKGEYSIDELERGEYVVRVGSYRSGVVKVYGDATFDIDVPITAHFAGRVLEADADVPISGVTIDVSMRDAALARTALQTSSNQLGEYSLSGLEPGAYILTVHKPGYELYREQLTYGSPVSDRTIRLRQSRGVNVRITDRRTRQPLRGVHAAEVTNGRAGFRIPLHPDENGYSQLPSELSGSDIAFSASGFFTIVVPRWNGRPIELGLPPEGQQ